MLLLRIIVVNTSPTFSCHHKYEITTQFGINRNLSHRP